MSTATHERTIQLKVRDDSTQKLLLLGRVMRSLSREIHFLQLAYRLLGDAEFIAALKALQLAAIMQMTIPIIGIFTSLLSFAAGMRMLQTQQEVMPVGQTLPGQVRAIGATGPIIAHAGEVIGRPLSAPKAGGMEGGVTINLYDAQLSTNRDIEETIEYIGTRFYHQFRSFKL